MESLYKASAFLGRGYALLIAVIATVITVGVIGFLLYKKQKLSGKGQALVVAQNAISYQVGGITFTKQVILPANTQVGSIVDIAFDPADPNNVQVGPINYKFILILAIVGIVICGFSWFYYWLTLNYKPIAAFEGAAIFVPGV